MAKPQPKQSIKKPKTLKEQKKELESRLFGEKDKKKKKEIQGMIKKLDLEIEKELQEKKNEENAKKQAIRQLIPVGIDPKTIYCLNFKNKNCDLGDKCQFSHVPIKTENKLENDKKESETKLVCKFLIDALNSREYSPTWQCPFPNCKDIHKLTEISENNEVEVSLEEFLELQRQLLTNDKLTPITEKTFLEWKKRKDKEEELHAKRIAALSSVTKGTDLFKCNPEIFEDENEGSDIDYYNREISEDSSITNDEIQ